MRVDAAGLVRLVIALAVLGPASLSRADTGLPESERAAVTATVGREFDFDIPAQPLVTALSQFADVPGRSALFPGTLVAGRHSSSLQGHYTAKDALQHLLAGSGLEVEEISAGQLAALILKPGAVPSR